MKKLLLITGAILAVYLVMTAMVTGDAQAPETVTAGSAVESSESGYMITSVDGMVAVIKDGELFMSTDTAVASLPKTDRNKITQGIWVNSKEELKSLLEDFCS